MHNIYTYIGICIHSFVCVCVCVCGVGGGGLKGFYSENNRHSTQSHIYTEKRGMME